MRARRIMPFATRHLSRFARGLRSLVVYTHRWLGIALGLLFAAWFVSGVVLMYVGMPRLSPAERLARLPALDFSRARTSPSEIASSIGAPADALQLAMVGHRPVYRIRSGSRSLSF